MCQHNCHIALNCVLTSQLRDQFLRLKKNAFSEMSEINFIMSYLFFPSLILRHPLVFMYFYLLPS